jgi:hypothetical protein
VRQLTDEKCFKIALNAGKKFSLYESQVRKMKRILAFIDFAQKKKIKAGDEDVFKNVTESMNISTSDGTSCLAAPSSFTEVLEVYTTLRNCKETASALCDLTITEGELITVTCKPVLEDYIEDFKACRGKNSTVACTCFQNLTIAYENTPDTCNSFLDLENSTRKKKNACTLPKTIGSFGDCRAAERKAAYLGPACRGCPTSTPQAPTVRRNLIQRKMFRQFVQL